MTTRHAAGPAVTGPGHPRRIVTTSTAMPPVAQVATDAVRSDRVPIWQELANAHNAAMPDTSLKAQLNDELPY